MDATEWTLPSSVKGPQVGQVMAGRYRLALFKGGDDIAEVWHAVDESTQQVVTLEILRDRGDEALRKRFLEQAERMAQIERPSVMKVAAIHDEASETFVVFEHLIPLALELPDLPPADAPAAAPAELKSTAAVARPETEALSAFKPAKAPELVTPVIFDLDTDGTSAKPADEASTPTVVIKRPSRPEALHVSSSLERAKSDATVLIASATRLAERARVFLRGLRLDTLVTTARARVPRRVDMSLVKGEVARLAQSARPMIVRARPMIARAIVSARPWIVRARHNQIVMAVVTAALVLAVFVASPLDDAISNALRPALPPTPTTAPTGPLAPAPFEVPPLSAYGATFESQAPYPTVSPKGTVEWVVALRNTGTAGWYRGFVGAQVSLALADGTGVAVQSTPYVAPGQVGWFVVHFPARAEPGVYNVSLAPRVDGRGPMPDLGIHVVVTVTKP